MVNGSNIVGEYWSCVAFGGILRYSIDDLANFLIRHIICKVVLKKFRTRITHSVKQMDDVCSNGFCTLVIFCLVFCVDVGKFYGIGSHQSLYVI